MLLNLDMFKCGLRRGMTRRPPTQGPTAPTCCAESTFEPSSATHRRYSARFAHTTLVCLLATSLEPKLNHPYRKRRNSRWFWYEENRGCICYIGDRKPEDNFASFFESQINRRIIKKANKRDIQPQVDRYVREHVAMPLSLCVYCPVYWLLLDFCDLCFSACCWETLQEVYTLMKPMRASKLISFTIKHCAS